jgi:hypothetical protein
MDTLDELAAEQALKLRMTDARMWALCRVPGDIRHQMDSHQVDSHQALPPRLDGGSHHRQSSAPGGLRGAAPPYDTPPAIDTQGMLLSLNGLFTGISYHSCCQIV